MKKRNYVAAILLASLMATSTAIAMPVTAADGDVTVTFAKDTIARDYEIYQIFTGTVTGTGENAVLTALQYGTGIDDTKTTGFAKPDDFADAFKDMSGVEAAEFLAGYLAGAPSTTVTSSKSANVTKDLAPGYYLIKDVTPNTDDGVKNDANSRYILEVVDPCTITPKKDVPSIDKKIGTDYDTGTKTSVASIGDKVDYVLKSAVPDMTGYNRYYFVINDTMESGLTFNNDVVITIDGKVVNPNQYEVQTGDDADPYTFQIVMKDFYANYYLIDPADDEDDGSLTDAPIIVKYSATLNEGAELYKNSNDNTVNLTYSNNPNYDYEGGKDPNHPDEPPTGDDAPPTGVTPPSQTQTFTTGIKIKKIDGADHITLLDGVKFRLSGEGVKTTYVNEEYFTVDNANGTYWQLKNGLFTETDPNGDGVKASDYVSTTTKYKKVTSSAEIAALQNITTEAVTAGGELTFTGLVPGQYTITEVEPLPGYNPIDPIDITITAAKSEGEYVNSGWTAADGDGADLSFDDGSTNCFEIEIENNQGVTLPETGGIGTVLFYVVGGTLVAGSLVLLITKKRMGEKE